MSVGPGRLADTIRAARAQGGFLPETASHSRETHARKFRREWIKSGPHPETARELETSPGEVDFEARRIVANWGKLSTGFARRKQIKSVSGFVVR